MYYVYCDLDFTVDVFPLQQPWQNYRLLVKIVLIVVDILLVLYDVW